MNPTNILLIYSDQHRFDCIGANGHPLLKTPHLDRLAAEGINFSQAYCPAPICVPTRNSLFHGQWPTSHLAIANWDSEAPQPAIAGLPTFSQTLRQAGYFLGYVGKWHVHASKTALDFGFHDYVDEDSYDAWRAIQGLSPRPFTNRWFGELDPYASPEESRLAWGAGETLQLLEHCAERDLPFCVIWSPSEPHLPNVLPEPYYSLYPHRDIPPWPSFPDPLRDKPFIQAQQRRTWKVDQWAWEDWARIVSRYLGEISLLDAQVGQLLDGLDRLGLAENTLVVYTTDHGDMCGGHGMIDKHFVMYDDVVRVPLIARWPGHIAPGSIYDSFICNGLDLPATFCEAAGIPVPPTFQGKSLLPIFAGAREDGRSDILSMYHGNQFGLYSQRMLRDRHWKYVWNATAEDELYDLEHDPGELSNLAGELSYKDELTRMRHRLVAWMEAAQDRLLNAWTRVQLLEGLKGP